MVTVGSRFVFRALNWIGSSRVDRKWIECEEIDWISLEQDHGNEALCSVEGSEFRC
jgi:hypothetical protein